MGNDRLMWALRQLARLQGEELAVWRLMAAGEGRGCSAGCVHAALGSTVEIEDRGQV